MNTDQSNVQSTNQTPLISVVPSNDDNVLPMMPLNYDNGDDNVDDFMLVSDQPQKRKRDVSAIMTTDDNEIVNSADVKKGKTKKNDKKTDKKKTETKNDKKTETKKNDKKKNDEKKTDDKKNDDEKKDDEKNEEKKHPRKTREKTLDMIDEAINRHKMIGQYQRESVFDVVIYDMKLPKRGDTEIKKYLLDLVPETVTGHETVRQLVCDWILCCIAFVNRAKRMQKKMREENYQKMFELASLMLSQRYAKEKIEMILKDSESAKTFDGQIDQELIHDVIENL